MGNAFLFPIAACGLSLVFFAICICLIRLKKRPKQPPHIGPHSLADSPSKRQMAELTAEIERVRSRLEELEQQPLRTAPNWNLESAPINLNRRGQVLRLLHRGDQAADVASTLGISRGEVLLTLKVHQLSRAAQPEKTSANVL